MNRRLHTIIIALLTTLSVFNADARPALKRPALKLFRAAQRAFPFAQRGFPVIHRPSLPTAQRFSWRNNNGGKNGHNWNGNKDNSKRSYGTWAKPSVLSGLFAGVILNDEIKRQQTPALPLTQENVLRHGNVHLQTFIEQATQNITSQDPATIEAICTLIENYSGEYKRVAHKLTDVSMKNFAAVNAEILQTILKYNPQAAESFAKVAIETDNRHLAKIGTNPKQWMYTLGGCTTYDPDCAQTSLTNNIIATFKNQNQSLSGPHTLNANVRVVTRDYFPLWDRQEITSICDQHKGKLGIHNCNSYAKYLYSPPIKTSVITFNNLAIGFIEYSEQNSTGYIRHFAIDSKYQRQGLGQQLMKHAVQNLKNAGAKEIHLGCFQDNTNAIKFYTNYGFTRSSYGHFVLKPEKTLQQ